MNALQRIKPYEAKKALTTLLSKVAYGNKPVILESRGHDLAALISMEHFRILLETLARKEDEEDWKEAEAALAELKGKRIAWEQLKDELNLPDRVHPAGRKAVSKARTTKSQRGR
jgi:PHD/YefM family antitoxin component YafN of YafNO toxin-antitoxin module